MKAILLFLVLGLAGVTAARAAERPIAEIVDFGIYSGGQNEILHTTNAPNGKIIQTQGELKLEKQTTKIPAKLGTSFGFRYVMHGKPEEGEILLHCAWLYPEMTGTVTGKKSHRFDAVCHCKPEDRNAGVMWTFTEPSELVPGEWTFQVYRGEAKILEKKFDVEKPEIK